MKEEGWVSKTAHLNLARFDSRITGCFCFRQPGALSQDSIMKQGQVKVYPSAIAMFRGRSVAQRRDQPLGLPPPQQQPLVTAAKAAQGGEAP